MGLLKFIFKALGSSSRSRNRTASAKGQAGEKQLLRNLKSLNCYKLFVPNIRIKYTNNQYTEIDLVMITEYGVFVYEVKNYDGSVYGNATSQQWKVYLGGQEYTFYNPVLQNKGHIYALRKATKLDTSSFYSMIVFGDNAKAKIYNADSKEYKITNLKTAHQLTNTLLHNRKAIFEKSKVDDIYSKLLSIKNTSEQDLSAN